MATISIPEGMNEKEYYETVYGGHKPELSLHILQ